MNDLKNYRAILQEKSAQVKNFLRNIPKTLPTLRQNFLRLTRKKFRNTEPEIMFYGIYNAGKSSILNEFIGADKAEVNNKPTTDKITYHDWNSYKIADTPGIFAPVVHEEITQEHFQRQRRLHVKNLEANENSELIKNMNRVLENFSKQKILTRHQINIYIDTQAEFFGNNLSQIIWANRKNQDKINEVVAQEISRLNEKVQSETQRQMQDAAEILELELKSFAEIKIDNKNIDAEVLKNVLSQLNKINS